MNGPVVCSSHSVAPLSGPRSISPAHDEIKLTQEGRRSPACFQPHDAPGQGDGRRTDATSTAPKASETRHPEMESSNGQCSPRRSGAPLPRAQTCSGSPAELPLQTGTSSSPAPLHVANDNNNNNNNKSSSSSIIALQSRQRRGRCRKVKEKRSTLRIAGGKNSQNRKVTDYYPIRRSSRKSQTELKCEEKKLIDDLITKGIEEGMEVQHIEGKGRAVFATRCFQKGEYVVEYHGDLLQITDAKTREAEYAEDPATGCYMYYFQYLGKTYCVDATRESERKGRLINHSKNGNCQTKVHDIDGVPHLVLVASRRVDEGEELLYDYGDRSKASIAAHPWLKH